MDAARRAMRAEQFTPVDRTVTVVSPHALDSVAPGLLAPLLAGGQLRTVAEHTTTALLDAVDEIDATMIVLPSALGDALRDALGLPGWVHADPLARVKRVVRVTI
jgi:non-ribosomal peptide synthetase component F